MDEATAPSPKKGPVAGVTFTVPESARTKKTDPKLLTYAELTLEQEFDAGKVAEAAGGTNASLTVELVKRSVVAVDGRPVDWSGEGPEWYDRASPKVRQLAARAFVKVNRPSDVEEADFLDSAVVTSG